MDGNACGNERGAEPKRQARGARKGVPADDLQLLKEQTKAGDNEAKTHQSQSGAHPSQEGSLGCKVVAQVGPLRWRHFAV